MTATFSPLSSAKPAGREGPLDALREDRADREGAPDFLPMTTPRGPGRRPSPRRTDGGARPARARARRPVGHIRTFAHCRYRSEWSPEESLKWPSARRRSPRSGDGRRQGSWFAFSSRRRPYRSIFLYRFDRGVSIAFGRPRHVAAVLGQLRRDVERSDRLERLQVRVTAAGSTRRRPAARPPRGAPTTRPSRTTTAAAPRLGRRAVHVRLVDDVPSVMIISRSTWFFSSRTFPGQGRRDRASSAAVAEALRGSCSSARRGRRSGTSGGTSSRCSERGGVGSARRSAGSRGPRGTSPSR